MAYRKTGTEGATSVVSQKLIWKLWDTTTDRRGGVLGKYELVVPLLKVKLRRIHNSASPLLFV